MSGIRVEHLTKTFGDFVAVGDAGFSIEEGELAALLGPSGSGKSTILRIIAGLERPDSGKVFLTGKDVTSARAQERNIGFVFQHYALFKHMTVEQNIAFGLELRKKNKAFIKEKVDELIDLVKLNGYDHHYPSQLSGGQRQRVALARALASEPRVLLLDEPFGSLDARVRKNLAHWIRDLHKRINVTGVFVTHDQDEAMEISDKIILVNRGRIEQVGTPHEIYEFPQTKFVASFVGNVNVIDACFEEEGIFIKGLPGGTGGEYFLRPEETGPEVNIREHGDIVLLARPEEISILKENGKRNAFPGAVSDVHYRGGFYEIEITVGSNRVKSTIDKDVFLEQPLEIGQKVYVRFKQYKVFDAPEGSRKVHAMLKQLGYIE